MQDEYKYAPLNLYNWVTDLVYRTSGATVVKSERDWKVMEQIFEFWAKKWPHETQEFIRTVSLIRDTRGNSKALSSTKEIQYTATLPPRFMRLIKAVFPKQQFDKKFIYKLCLRMPIFKISRA